MRCRLIVLCLAAAYSGLPATARTMPLHRAAGQATVAGRLACAFAYHLRPWHAPGSCVWVDGHIVYLAAAAAN